MLSLLFEVSSRIYVYMFWGWKICLLVFELIKKNERITGVESNAIPGQRQ